MNKNQINAYIPIFPFIRGLSHDIPIKFWNSLHLQKTHLWYTEHCGCN